MRRPRRLAAALLPLLLLLALPERAGAFAKRGSPRRNNNKRGRSSKGSGGGGFQAPNGSADRPKQAAAAKVVVQQPRPDARVSPKLAVGLDLMAAGRHEEAGLAFEAIIDADPDAADAWSALGLCMHNMGQPDAALACQKQVMRIRGAEQAGGAAAYREAEFEALAAAAELRAARRPAALDCGGALDDQTGGRLWSAAVALCGWMGRHEAELSGATVLELGCGTAPSASTQRAGCTTRHADGRRPARPSRAGACEHGGEPRSMGGARGRGGGRRAALFVGLGRVRPWRV